MSVTNVAKDNALLQQIELCKQSGPSEHDLGQLRLWLHKERGNNSALRGPGSRIWETEGNPDIDAENDFVVLSSKHRDRDHFERWTGDTFLGKYHRFIAKHFVVCPATHTFVLIMIALKHVIKDEEYGLTEYDDAKISTAANIFCTLLAPILTTVPMFILYFVSDVKKRLGIVTGFTTLFSIS